MPTYEYQCNSCKAVYELRQGFDAATKHKCEECGKGTAKRVLHAPPVVFKGGGWYLTDSRKSGTAAVSDGDSSTSSSEKAASEPKKETKAEAKAESSSSSSDAAAAS